MFQNYVFLTPNLTKFSQNTVFFKVFLFSVCRSQLLNVTDSPCDLLDHILRKTIYLQDCYIKTGKFPFLTSYLLCQDCPVERSIIMEMFTVRPIPQTLTTCGY